MSEGIRLDGGYGFVGDMGLIMTLENLTLEERIEYCKKLQKKDPVAFNEFCEDHPEIIKELGLKDFI